MRTRPLIPVFFLLLLSSCGDNPLKPRETEPPIKVEKMEMFNEANVLLEKEGVEYAYPHFSMDASRILFQSNESGKWKLFILDLSDTSVRELTRDTSNNFFPDWSPDNKRVCFVSDRSGYEEIYVMNSDGTGVKQLTKNKARNIHPYFSPDGKKILFSTTWNTQREQIPQENLELYQMDPDGSGLKRVTNTLDDETCARFSPDNTQILFLRNNITGLDDLFLMDVKTGADTNLTNTPTTDGWPCWTPDGKSIVYSAIEKGTYKLYQYTVADRSQKRLTAPSYPMEDCRANVSPDGKRVVFNRQSESPKGRTNAIWVLEL